MIPCKLVHDTGTMIRFRTSQLGELPRANRDIRILLPSGGLVDAHFNRHPQNPNVSGTGVVRFIKARMEFGSREDVLVEQSTRDLWVVHLLDGVLAVTSVARVPSRRIREGDLRAQDISALAALADREADRGRRIAVYSRVLRPSGLRRLVIGLTGGRCMVAGCDACESFDNAWGTGSGVVIVEVHHIEQVARTVDHYPRNLCVLCGNHHRFVHGSGPWTIRHDGSDVVCGRHGRELVIARPANIFPPG